MLRFLLAIAIALLAVFGPLLVPKAFTEEVVDNVFGRLNSEIERNTSVAIVEVKGANVKWPINRSSMARAASEAVANGAAAVGIAVDMSHPSQESEDRALLELIQRDKRIIPLSLLRELNASDNGFGAEGFVFDGSAKFVGIFCDPNLPSQDDPFSIRLAIAGGVNRSELYSNCSGSVLKPYLRSTAEQFPVVPMEDLLVNKTVPLLKGKVAIFGTVDPNLGINSYSGTHSSTVIDANVVESALKHTWRRPHIGASSLIYAVIILLLFISVRYGGSTSRVLLLSGLTLLFALATRWWVWYPILPAMLLILGNLFWELLRGRNRLPDNWNSPHAGGSTVA